jgi:hypothetical protein
MSSVFFYIGTIDTCTSSFHQRRIIKSSFFDHHAFRVHSIPGVTAHTIGCLFKVKMDSWADTLRLVVLVELMRNEIEIVGP